MTAVRDIMTEGCECIGENQTLLEAARKMRELNVGALPICGEDDRLKGMLTDRDIVVRCLADDVDPRHVAARNLAEGKPYYVQADASTDEVVRAMAEHKVRRLPVIENKRLVGIVSQADVARTQPPQKSGHAVAEVSSDG
jgi:CBS domain-containing protein